MELFVGGGDKCVYLPGDMFMSVGMSTDSASHGLVRHL